MMKAMRPINQKKGNKQVRTVAGGVFPGALCGAVGVVVGVGALAGRPPWPLEPDGTEKSVCGLAWPLAFPCPIGACGKVPSSAGSPSSGYLGTLGGGSRLRGVGR